MSGGSAAISVLVATALEFRIAVFIDSGSREVVNTREFVCGVEETGELHRHFVARAEVACLLTSLRNSLDMYGFADKYLIFAYACFVGELNNLAAKFDSNCVFLCFAVVGYAFGREAVVGGCVRADSGICHFDALDVGWLEGICIRLFCVKEIEYIEVCIVSRTCKFVFLFVGFVDSHTEFNTCSGIAYGYYKHAGVLRPDGRPVLAACHTCHTYGIIGYGNNGRAVGYGVKSTVCINGYYRVVCLAVQVGYGIGVVRLNEIVGCDRVDNLPVAQSKDIVGVALVEFEVLLGVDVEEDVSHIIAVVALYVVVNPLGVFGCHILFGNDEVFYIRFEYTCIGQCAFFGNAVVIFSAFGKSIVVGLSVNA